MLKAETFRDFLELLKKNGLCGTVSRRVEKLREVPAVLWKSLTTTGQAIHFTDVGMEGTTVAGNVFTRRDKFAALLGVPEEKLGETFERFWDFKPVEPKQVNNAVSQDVVHEGDIDIPSIIPAPIHFEHNGGPFITAGLILVRDPDTGAMNASFQRVQVHGGNKLGIQILPRMDLRPIHDAAVERGQELPVAIAIGVEPAIFLAGGIHIPFDADEYAFAGALMGKPLDVAAAKTNDLLVPANSELLLEGFISPTEMRDEGPFGEVHRYYGGSGPKPVINVTAVTHQRNHIHHTMFSGNLEEHMVVGLPREGHLLHHLRKISPEVKAVSFYPYVLRCVASVGNCDDATLDRLLEGMMEHSWVRMGILVNDDIDIDDSEDVLWAILTRTDPKRDYRVEDFRIDEGLEDIHFPPFASKRSMLNETPPDDGAILSPFDLNFLGQETMIRVGINAAVPGASRPWFLRPIVPGAKELTLADYLDH